MIQMETPYHRYIVIYDLRGSPRKFVTYAPSFKDAISCLEDDLPHLAFFPGNYDGSRESVTKMKITRIPEKRLSEKVSEDKILIN